MYYFKGVFAGIPVTFGFMYTKTVRYYENWLIETDKTENCVIVPQWNIEYWQRQWNVSDPAVCEYAFSCGCASDYLMQFNRVVFHGAAFLWNGKAYVFTAPSGTGKTTQLNLWKSLYDDEVTILNGDKPILEVNHSEIIVHPSPWKGKEGMGTDDITAPLGGIIMLKQAKENMIERKKPDDVIRHLFGRFYSTYDSETLAYQAAHILEEILKHVPVWMLSNKGDAASVLLTRQAMIEVAI